MDDILHYTMSVLLGIVVLLLILAYGRGDRMERDVQKQAIERGYALYCPADGEFAWKGECEEEQ